MSVIWTNLIPRAGFSSDSVPKSSLSLIKQSSLHSESTSQSRPRTLLCGPVPRANVIFDAYSATKPVSSSLLKCYFAALSAGSSPGEVNSEVTTKHLEKVIISTTKTSRTAREISGEPEYTPDRYVKESLTYQIQLSESFCLDEEVAKDVIDDDVYEDYELWINSTGGKETSTIGSLWSSETYLRQALKRRLTSKEVALIYSEDQLPDIQYSEDSETIQETAKVHFGKAPKESITDEEELVLRHALESKKRVAREILEASLEAAELSPTYTKELVSFMSPFIDRVVTEAVALKKYPISKDLSFNSRARLYIRQSEVVKLVKWLKHNKLTAPRIGSLISTADEYLGRIKSRIDWLKSINVRGSDLGVVIERQPRILELPLKDLKKTVELFECMGLQRKWLGLVVRREPSVLTLSKEELVARISVLTGLGISAKQFGVMIFNFPAALGRFSAEEMDSKVEYLRQIEVDEAALAKIITSTPQLLACSIEESWVKLLRYFYFLRIELAGVRRILGVQPLVFCLSLADTIAPKVKFLRAIGVDEEAIGQLIVDFPAVLTYSLEKKIRPMVRFLLEDAGVTEDKVGKVLALQPELVRCSLPDKLEVLVKYFRSKGIAARHIGAMIEDYPALLMYSLPTLHPKFQYMTKVMKRPVNDVIIFPRYFSYSLKARIIPRHELLMSKGLMFSLRHMLACSEDIFNNRVAKVEVFISREHNAEPERGPQPICAASEQSDYISIAPLSQTSCKPSNVELSKLHNIIPQ